MLRSIPQNIAQTSKSRTVMSGFLGVSALLAVLLAVAAQTVFGTATFPLVGFVAGLTIAAIGLSNTYPHAALGACNVITLTRLAMVAFLTGALFAVETSAWVVFSVASVAFALDGIDGWLARRARLVSDFGARFDMETDAALSAVIALWLLLSGTTGPEVLILGFMRYAFLAATFVLPALRAPLPQAFRRKAVCVVQIAALIALIFPPLPEALALPISLTAAVLLSWSFLIDISWLLRRAE